MRRSRILLALLGGVLVAALSACHAVAAPKASAGGYRPRPEVFWVTVSVNGRRAGFGRGEYTRGEAAAYQYQNLILFTHAGYRHAQRDWWEFGPDLRPVNFFQKVISWKAGYPPLTNTIDGVFHYDKGQVDVEYDQFNTHEKAEVPIPRTVIARFTQNLVLARERLSPGRVFRFNVYDMKNKRFAAQTFKVMSWDAALRAWKIEQTSEEAPGAVSLSWFQTASPSHPNGWVLRSVTPGAERQTIELRAATRAEAVAGFEKEATSLGI